MHDEHVVVVVGAVLVVVGTVVVVVGSVDVVVVISATVPTAYTSRRAYRHNR